MVTLTEQVADIRKWYLCCARRDWTGFPPSWSFVKALDGEPRFTSYGDNPATLSWVVAGPFTQLGVHLYWKQEVRPKVRDGLQLHYGERLDTH